MIMETKFNPMQTVKRHFFAMRNGIIADTLRKSGSPYHIIFGLNLPQLTEIAAMTPHTVELADALHDNRDTRCSRLLAPMIHPRELMDVAKALRWLREVRSSEEADILCHKLIRYLPFAGELVQPLLDSDDELQRYTGHRLQTNLEILRN